MITLAQMKYCFDCVLQMQVLTFIHQQCGHIWVAQTEQSGLNAFQEQDARQADEVTPGSEVTKQEQCTLAANGQERSKAFCD